MPDVGFIDLKISFPDPVTERGRAVNTIELKVLNAFGVVLATFGINDLDCVETVFGGVYYVRRNYDVSDPARTPDTYITLSYSGTVGAVATVLRTRKISFQPSIGDATSGVLLQWEPPEIPEDGQIYVDPLFYEVRRIDERYGRSERDQTQFVPETWSTSFWPFDADFDDDVTPAANLVATGFVGMPVGAGIIGNCARFNGFGWLSAANPAKLSYAADQDFSISAWVTVTPSFTLGIVCGKIAAATGQGYGIYVEQVGQDYVPVVVINGPVNKVSFPAAGKNLNDGQWHHLVATFDRDSDVKLYVDGVWVAGGTIDQTANVDFNTEDFYVGGNGVENFVGLVDEVITFNRLLTWIDVETLYNDQYGIPYEEILGRTTFLQYVDTTSSNPHQMRYYKWFVYRAMHTPAAQPDGKDYTMVLYKTITVKEVDFIDAPLCFVEGRIRLPTDEYPQAAIAKFFVASWDQGQVVHDRILSRDQWWADIDRNGRFGAFLIRDAVVVCHIPAAHIQWRFCVPRQERVTIQDLLAQGKIEKQKFRNNL